MEEDMHIGGYEGTEPIINEPIGNLPSNGTLLTLQLTEEEDDDPEVVRGVGCLEELFAHYQPKITLDFVDEEGGNVTEELKYRRIKDFSPKGIIEQSDFLQGVDREEGHLNELKQQLFANKRLKKALATPEGSQAFINAVDYLITELEATH